jgi:uncharacterized protein (TIGR03545 family)
MNNPLRISGLMLFIFIIGIISAAYLIFADRFLKSSIIEIGTEVVGAKVDLNSSSLNLNEFSVLLRDLAITNPNAPMRNIVEAGNITFNLNSDALLWKKTIIDEIAVENLFIDTARSESGAIDGRKISLDNIEMFDNLPRLGSFTNIDLPDPKTILAKSNLQTLTEIKKFKGEIIQQQTALQTEYKTLPNKATLDKYKEQLNAIKKNNKSGNKLLSILSQGSELKDLQKAIKKDLNSITTFGNKVKDTQSSLLKRISYIKTLPEKDLKQLTSQYSLSGGGMSNLAGALFGEQLGGWVKEGLVWYKRLAPLLDQVSMVSGSKNVAESKSYRNSGREILFQDQQNLPDNLVKLIKVSTGKNSAEGIRISGVIKNITNQPQRWNKPLEFDLQGNSEYFERMDLSGTLDHRQKDQFNDHFKLKLNKLSLTKLSDLANSSSFVATEGQLNVYSSGVVTEEKLDLSIVLVFSKARFKVSKNNQQSSLLNKITEGLAELDAFKIEVNITGSLDNPELSITAPDLSGLMAKIAEKALAGKLKEFESQLKAEIFTQTTGQLNGLTGNIDAFSSLENQLETKEDDYLALLKGLF